jgi:hypothetical protein
VSDTFLSGSWNDQNLTRFNRQGDILASWDTALNLAGLAYNPASGHLYALVNAAGAYDFTCWTCATTRPCSAASTSPASAITNRPV